MPKKETQPPKIESGIQEVSPDCKHHWMIESPAGPKSLGVCKNCGAKREFKNSSYYEAGTQYRTSYNTKPQK